MDNQLEVVELALTVLVAITEHHEPQPSDVAQLRRIFPAYVDRPVDELARNVIRHASNELYKIR
jgi:hypothetical protein